MTGVRLREGALEGKCEACLEWWPLGEDWRDYWYPRRGLARCVACQRLFQAGNLRRYREDPVLRARHAKVARDYYAANSTWINGKRMTREEAALKRMSEPDKAEQRRRYNRLYQRRRRQAA